MNEERMNEDYATENGSGSEAVVEAPEEKSIEAPAGSTDGSRNFPEITIKFGKGLCGDPFTAKDGKAYVEIKIPNVDPGDHRPWESFILPAKRVHENKFGKGLWAKIPENGSTTLSRPQYQGKNEQGVPVWHYEKRNVTNQELKALVESYKTKNRSRESVTGSLKKGKEIAEKEEEAKSDEFHKVIGDELPFR